MTTTPIYRTTYHGPTDHRGARVSAENVTSRKRLTLPWDHAADVSENHEAAARQLASSLGHRLVSRCSVDGGGFLFVARVRS